MTSSLSCSAGQREGTIRDGDPGLLALGVLGAVSSFTHAWRNGRTEVDANELAEAVGVWVTRALAR